MTKAAFCVLGFLACAIPLPPAMAADSAAQAGPRERPPLRLAQCSRRIGPFATQDTAWARWREARDQGLSVSAGVFPCYDQGTRGYCFNVFGEC